MAITFAEHAESRQMALTVGGEGQRLRFTAYRDDDQAAVRAAFLAFIPETWDDLTFVGADLRPYANSGLWDCTADYAYSAERDRYRDRGRVSRVELFRAGRRDGLHLAAIDRVHRGRAG